MDCHADRKDLKKIGPPLVIEVKDVTLDGADRVSFSQNKTGCKMPPFEQVDDVRQRLDAIHHREHDPREHQNCYDDDAEQHLSHYKVAAADCGYQRRDAREYHDDHRHVIENVVDDNGRCAVRQADRSFEQHRLGRVAKERADKADRVHRVAAKPRRHCTAVLERAVLGRNRNIHRQGAPHVPRQVERNDNEKSPADTRDRLEDIRVTDAVNDKDKYREPDEEHQGLHRDQPFLSAPTRLVFCGERRLCAGLKRVLTLHILNRRPVSMSPRQ